MHTTRSADGFAVVSSCTYCRPLTNKAPYSGRTRHNFSLVRTVRYGLDAKVVIASRDVVVSTHRIQNTAFAAGFESNQSGRACCPTWGQCEAEVNEYGTLETGKLAKRSRPSLPLRKPRSTNSSKGPQIPKLRRQVARAYPYSVHSYIDTHTHTHIAVKDGPDQPKVRCAPGLAVDCSSSGVTSSLPPPGREIGADDSLLQVEASQSSTRTPPVPAAQAGRLGTNDLTISRHPSLPQHTYGVPRYNCPGLVSS
ncbi:hypothetical protein LZ30DRAFT_141289 [Colletotrichum cereale]|nr:hypothetical protein LZ30DRAFT_141289 [Colletotrichum cereale]